MQTNYKKTQHRRDAGATNFQLTGLGVGSPGEVFCKGKGAYEKPFAPSPRFLGGKTIAFAINSFSLEVLKSP